MVHTSRSQHTTTRRKTPSLRVHLCSCSLLALGAALSLDRKEISAHAVPGSSGVAAAGNQPAHQTGHRHLGGDGVLSASVFVPIPGHLGDMVGKKKVLVAVLVALTSRQWRPQAVGPAVVSTRG